MNKPEYVKVDGEIYKINTDFRIALECNTIAEDTSIGDFERALAIIYKLFGEKGLECKNQSKLLELAMKYISLGNYGNTDKEKQKMDYELDFSKCIGLIKSSFKFDYNYDPYELEYLHWYDFYNDLQNLSTSEFGNCCALNRILTVLNEDVSKIKDTKQRTKIMKAKELIKQKYCKNNKVILSKEQENSMKEFYKALGIKI